MANLTIEVQDNEQFSDSKTGALQKPKESKQDKPKSENRQVNSDGKIPTR